MDTGAWINYQDPDPYQVNALSFGTVGDDGRWKFGQMFSKLYHGFAPCTKGFIAVFLLF